MCFEEALSNIYFSLPFLSPYFGAPDSQNGLKLKLFISILSPLMISEDKKVDRHFFFDALKRFLIR